MLDIFPYLGSKCHVAQWHSAASLRFQLADSPSGQTKLHQTLLFFQSLHRINTQNALADHPHIWAGHMGRLVIVCIEEPKVFPRDLWSIPHLVICRHMSRFSVIITQGYVPKVCSVISWSVTTDCYWLRNEAAPSAPHPSMQRSHICAHTGRHFPRSRQT